LSGTYKSGFSKLKLIARDYESKNSLGNILSVKNSPKGRSVSNKKLLYRNRTGLSATTLKLVEDSSNNEQNELDRIEQRLRDTENKLNQAQTEVKKTNIRVGYSMEKPHEGKRLQMDGSLNNEITKSKIKNLLEQYLGDFPEESAIQIEDPSNPENQKPLSARSREPVPTTKPDRGTRGYTKNRSYSPKKIVKKHGEFFDLPVDTRPYPPDTADFIKDKTLMKNSIINNPRDYKEHILRRELLGLPFKCHPTGVAKTRPPINRNRDHSRKGTPARKS